MVSWLNLPITLKISYRYLITNYEQSNFSVYQARFEEGLPEQIIAIPSINSTTLTRKSSPVSKKSTVGLSVGTSGGLLVLIFVLVFATRKLRGRTSKKVNLNGTGMSNSIYEIDNNSLFWGFRELSDTGRAELLDQQMPSGSGKVIHEMPTPSPPLPTLELMAGPSLRNQSLMSANRSQSPPIRGNRERYAGDVAHPKIIPASKQMS